MNQSSKIKWLYDQLPALVEKGVLSPEAATRVKKYFGEPEASSSYGLGVIIAAVLGAVLVGGGIILIFAYNWENLSVAWRTFFSMLPLVIAQCFYGYAFFRKKDDRAWTEATSAFLMLMLASSIALISQTYNISGSTEGFLLVWMVLSIPLLYMMNSSLPAMIYLGGIAAYAVNASGSSSVLYWPLLLAAIPHLYKNSTGDIHGNRAAWLAWIALISFGIAHFSVIEPEILAYSLLGTAWWLGAFYLFGARYYDQKAKWIQRPLQTFAVLLIFLISFALCYEWPDEKVSLQQLFYGQDYLGWAALTNFIVWLIAMAAYLWLLWGQIRKKEEINHFVAVFPVMILLGLLLMGWNQKGVALVLANIYLLLISVRYILNGISSNQMGYINLGMFFISAQIVIRFFATDLGPLTKGIIFVVLGLSFLAVNVIFSKRIKTKG